MASRRKAPAAPTPPASTAAPQGAPLTLPPTPPLPLGAPTQATAAQGVGQVTIPAVGETIPKAPEASDPRLDEVAYWERSLYALGVTAPRFNPDTLVRQKGLSVYLDMRNDEQVKAVMQFKRDAIFGRGWTLQYDAGSPLDPDEQQDRIQTFEYLLTKTIEGSFEDGLNIIATGRDFGYSLSEKVYTQVNYDGTMRIGLRMLLFRDPRTFYFITDQYGMLVRCEQWVNGRRQDVDLSKFVYYVHNPEFDRYYGRSDLREAYKPWYIKQRMDDYWALYMERFAGGFLIVNQAADSTTAMIPGTPLYTSMQNMLEHLHGATGIILPKGLTAQLLFPPAQDQFEVLINQKDAAIAKALLVPNLLGLSQSTQRRGSTEQATTQLEAFVWTLNSDGRRVETCIDEQLIKDLGDQNYADGFYPSFKFKPLSLDFLKWLVTTWGTLTQQGTVVNTLADETFLRRLMGMPDREPDEPGLRDPQAVLEQQQNQQSQLEIAKAQGQAPAPEGKPPVANDTKEFTALLERIEVRLAGLEQTRTAAPPTEGRGSAAIVPLPIQARPHGKLRLATMQQFQSAVQRVAFSVIERKQEGQARDLTDALAQRVGKVTRRLLGTDEQLAKLTDTDVSDIQSVELSSAEKGQLQSLCKRALTQSWDFGISAARNELDRAKGEKRTTFADLRDQAASYFETRSFRMAGDVSNQVQALIQQELMTSVRYGRTPGQTREAIWGRLLDRGLTTGTYVKQNETDADVQRALDELGLLDEAAASAYLDTLARTNLFEAMNEARFAEFTDPALDGFVEALEYSAILDERTTEICTALDGDTWSSDNPLWDKYRPPNHFNCRSVLVPITQADGWDGEEDPAPDIEPAAGFGGGAKS